MGVVFSSASDFVVKLFCSCLCDEVHHICRLDKNLKALDQAMVVLKARRDDVSGRVESDEYTGLQRLNGVDVWLTAVGEIENQAHQTATACARQGSSLCEVCSRKLVSRFRYGKYVFSMLEDVKELTERKLTEDFHAVAQPPRRDVVEERALEPIIVGQETILESAWSRLRDDGTLRMGIYGMGGVGKTTLLDQINNKFCGANDGGHRVIWIVVSKDKRNEKIQDEIAEKLGFSTREESWKQKTETEKASDIRKSMMRKRFVLLLDDIWSKVELKDIGVPYPTRENKCKIVFTTRSKEVCGRMGDTNPIEVSCLDTNKAWELFKEKVGETTLGSHPDIPKLARKVAGKCHGLPLALNVLGETMSFKDTIQEWRNAFNVLTSSAAEFSGMDDKVLPILKYSYDSLEEHVKQCFLYCSLFSEDFEISKDVLIEYWICEGFVQEKQHRENAFDKGYVILSTLVRACLLFEELTNKLHVKMHDVIREMALWVASDLGEHKGRYTVHAGVGLRELPEVENWRLVRKMSLMNNEIKELSDIPYCPELTTLLLRENRLVHISGELFQSMPNIVVLDLSGNKSLVGLPEQISELISLRYLNLSHTNIKQLLVGLQKLRKLIYLNLEWTRALESISGISKLWRLRILRMLGSKISPDVNFVNELEILEHLEVLTIEISSSLVAHKFLSCDRLVHCTENVILGSLHELLTLPTMGSLSFISIWSCEMQEIKIVKTSAPWENIPASPCFSSLCRVLISNCDGLKDLTWLLFAPNLTDLKVSESDQLEDIISEEKALSSITDDEAGSIIPFRKLEKLQLWSLPMLKSIYWNTLPFPCLREIVIGYYCPNLRKLALGSQSVDRIGEFGITYSEYTWIKNVEWEDEATLLRFSPKCRSRY